MTGSPACAGPSCTCASARRWRAPSRAQAARWPISRTTSPSRRRSAAPRAGWSTTSSPPARPTSALAFDEAVARLRTALDLQIESPQRRAEVLIELALANHRAGNALDALEALRDAAQIARELRRPGPPRTRRDRLRGRLLAPGHGRPGRGRAARGGDGGARRGELRDARRPPQRSRTRTGLPGRPRARGGRPHQRHRHGAASSGDRTGLATVLMRAYWSRGKNSLDEILAMLTEAAAIGEELGNTEIRAEAMSWRVPTFVALGDIDAARREVAALQETAEQTAQPFMLHVAAHYGAAIALCDGRLDDAEVLAGRSHDWSRLLTGRDASGVHGIQMFGIRREQGRLAELAPVIRLLAGQPGSSGPWRPGLVSVLVELGMDAAARARARAGPHRRPGQPARVAVAGLAHLPDRRLRGAGRRGDRGARLSRARAAGRHQRDDRPPRRLLRRGRSLPGHARGDARRVGARRGALRARHRAQPAHGDADVARPHAPPARPRADRARRRRGRRPAAARGGGDRRGQRPARAARAHPIDRSSSRRPRRTASRRPLVARGRDPRASSPVGSATARSAPR